MAGIPFPGKKFFQLGDGPGFRQLSVVPAGEELKEDPLGPFIIIRIGCPERAAPVIAKTDIVELAAEVGDIIVRRDSGVDTVVDRILFGGKTKCIIAHRMQHVKPFQSLIAGKDIAGDITEGVADMQTRAAGIREHIQDIEFRFGRIVGHFIGAVRYPALLPFLFNFAEVIFHKPCWKKVKTLSGLEIMQTNNR